MGENSDFNNLFSGNHSRTGIILNHEHKLDLDPLKKQKHPFLFHVENKIRCSIKTRPLITPQTWIFM